MRAALQAMIGWNLAAPRPVFKPMRSLAEVAALPVCFGTRGGVAGGAAVAAKWLQINAYESHGYDLPADLQAWKASATNRKGSRLAEWKERLLKNLGDDGVLGRRMRFGQTLDMLEKRAVANGGAITPFQSKRARVRFTNESDAIQYGTVGGFPPRPRWRSPEGGQEVESQQQQQQQQQQRR